MFLQQKYRLSIDTTGKQAFLVNLPVFLKKGQSDTEKKVLKKVFLLQNFNQPNNYIKNSENELFF